MFPSQAWVFLTHLLIYYPIKLLDLLVTLVYSILFHVLYWIFDCLKQSVTNVERKANNNNSGCEPGTSGIYNYGNTCYLNSVLQCLVQTRMLYQYFLDDNYIIDINPHRGHIARAFGDVLRSLWSGERNVIYPDHFRNVVARYSPRFDNSEQHDAHEFLLALSEWIHEDLQQTIAQPYQLARSLVQESWLRETQGIHSVIRSTFFGQIRNVTKCVSCGHIKSTYEMFSQLPVCVPAHGRTTLERCVSNYCKEQEIQDYLCPECNMITNIKLTAEIVSFPPVLVFLLKRFCQKSVSGDVCFVKNERTVRYPLENLIVCNRKYFLYAVIVHIGTLHNGHYFSYCRHLQNNRWYKYNDEDVREVHKSEVLQPKGAFVLFYRTRDEERRAKHLQKNA